MRYRFKRKLFRLILQRNEYPREERRIYVSTLIYFIDYLLQIPLELTRKLRTEIHLSKEETEMMYLDRNNLPPTFGELMRQEREEVQKAAAREMLKDGMAVEQVAKYVKLSVEEVERLKKK